MRYITIDNSRKQITSQTGYAGKNTNGAIKVDCASPSEYHVLKTDYENFSGEDQWKVSTDKKQDVIAVLTARIETETETEILNGFEFAGKKFLLSDKNKFEYKAEFDIREHLTYPHRVKCVDGFYDVANTEEHQAWYMSGLAFVRTCTETSWNEIDDLQNKTTQELIVILNT